MVLIISFGDWGKKQNIVGMHPRPPPIIHVLFIPSHWMRHILFVCWVEFILFQWPKPQPTFKKNDPPSNNLPWVLQPVYYMPYSCGWKFENLWIMCFQDINHLQEVGAYYDSSVPKIHRGLHKSQGGLKPLSKAYIRCMESLSQFMEALGCHCS